MPLELGVWRMDNGVTPVQFSTLDFENRLEDVLQKNINIASPEWMIIGRQVPTKQGKYVDLLAIDRAGNLVVLELKRDKMYREAIAQVLDYGSWVNSLNSEEIVRHFEEYQKKWCPSSDALSIDEAFENKFGIPIPDEMNASHELVIVASELDNSTERIVSYLADVYGVSINAVFFRMFRDENREYLSRAWFRDPAELAVGKQSSVTGGDWNGEYYVSFGFALDIVRDGIKRGYIVAGGGAWYSQTLGLLEPGNRVWVNVPGYGYVGVGEVTVPKTPIEEFTVLDEKGSSALLIENSSVAAKLRYSTDNPETADYLVGIRWIATVDPSEAIREKGFFGNQNSVARPRASKWEHTIERLRVRFKIGMDA